MVEKGEVAELGSGAVLGSGDEAAGVEVEDGGTS